MFSQFRVRYPKGCLITDLLTIAHGKYVVRAMVQVEGVTLATGIAAADTVEMAEDNARVRALAILDLSPHAVSGEKTPPLTAPEPMPAMPKPAPQTAFSTDSLEQAQQSKVFPSAPQFDAAPSFSESKLTDVYSSVPPISSWDSSAIPFADEFSPSEVEMPIYDELSSFDTPKVMPKTSEKPGMKPAVNPEPYYSPEFYPASSGGPPPSEPRDYSQLIAQTDIEMQRLGWNQVQGRDYLLQKFNKRSRSSLTEPELKEFLHDLESMPAPSE